MSIDSNTVKPCAGTAMCIAVGFTVSILAAIFNYYINRSEECNDAKDKWECDLGFCGDVNVECGSVYNTTTMNEINKDYPNPDFFHGWFLYIIFAFAGAGLLIDIARGIHDCLSARSVNARNESERLLSDDNESIPLQPTRAMELARLNAQSQSYVYYGSAKPPARRPSGYTNYSSV